MPNSDVYTHFFEKARLYTEQEHAGLHVSPQTLSSKLKNANSSLKKIAIDLSAKTLRRS
ncbi:hypothetical protein [Candidatus Nitrosacidococcus tergens]|uniref:Uncharacterized protein n=1 Tax=Candidatus Nitrosacidococcus tergens TaxID=553981 RepID=A0A7G1QBP9_9GAMM|nr:hypothetical protein [Candidatus Nitrosacidococcus tergens]CAB1277161.1 protein of unknown function [Candidatus Nitrosacidococcus tergens]